MPAKQLPYSEKELQFISDLKTKGFSWSTIHTKVNSVFKTHRTFDGIKKKYSSLNPTPKTKQISYDKLEDFSKKLNDKEDSKVYKSILVISDLHIPYHHPDAFAFLKALKNKYKFDKIINIGDEIDSHAISFHDSDPNLPSAGDELKLARTYIKTLHNMFPRMDVVESNHGSLVYRKALASGLPREFFKSYNDILQVSDGWKWIFDLRVNTPIGSVYFCHGKAATAGKLASNYGVSKVQGHYHEKAQIHYIGTPDKLMYDMHVGCLADDKSLALGYNKINPKRPIVSVGIIINGIPQIVPMILKKGGRWNGQL